MVLAMNRTSLFILLLYPYLVVGNLKYISGTDGEEQRIDLIMDIISLNLKTNGWNNIVCFGSLPDTFYKKIKFLPLSFTVSNKDHDDHFVEDVVPYHSNTIIINCLNFGEFEESLTKVAGSPYWHPHSNIILYYHKKENVQDIARLFFILWYYRACNSIIVQYDDDDELLLISNYNPYISENYKLTYSFGCWTARKLGLPIGTFEKSFVCEEKCHNVTLPSKLRINNLGTCIGFDTKSVAYGDKTAIRNLNLFGDISKNLNGFPLLAYAIEVLPFLAIKDNNNGTYSLGARDGMVWNTLSELVNFSIDLSLCADIINKPYNFEINIQQIFSVAFRKGDLFLLPIYQFDVIVVELDNTFAYKESGLCLMSQRAGFETNLFDTKSLRVNYDLIIEFSICFICIWLLFSVYNFVDVGRFSFDQFGKDLVNTFRSVLIISLYNPPRRGSFRIFLMVSIWSFFIISFASQAAIISLFTAIKRGKDVNTFEDIIEMGYAIEGMASPDAMLPDTEERFRKINSKLVPIQNIFGCANHLNSNNRKFCLIDCAVSRYFERNMLNDRGEQFLHIAKDRVHSHYLNIILTKHSCITNQLNKHLIRFFEAGLIKKWEHYKYNDIKEEAEVKPLSVYHFQGIFNVVTFCLVIIFIIFLFELLFGNIGRIKNYCKLVNVRNWKRSSVDTE